MCSSNTCGSGYARELLRVMHAILYSLSLHCRTQLLVWLYLKPLTSCIHLILNISFLCNDGSLDEQEDWFAGVHSFALRVQV
jgi:hypothetical protein